MQETSLIAYAELKQGKLGSQQQTILNHLQHGRDYSLREIQRITGMADISTVAGRVNDLKKLKIIIESPSNEHPIKRHCSITGKLIQPVRLPAKQERLF